MTHDEPDDDPVWAPAVVAAVSRHMNEDHAQDGLAIVQRLGGADAATAAVMTGMDRTGIAFAVTEPGGSREVVVPWPVVPEDRAGVRAQVVALHAAATATRTDVTPGLADR